MKGASQIKVLLKMRCRDCGHIQIVSGFKFDGDDGVYFGSSYDWCDRCESGLPVAIEDLKEAE